jgi:hypothetical protein
MQKWAVLCLVSGSLAWGQVVEESTAPEIDTAIAADSSGRHLQTRPVAAPVAGPAALQAESKSATTSAFSGGSEARKSHDVFNAKGGMGISVGVLIFYPIGLTEFSQDVYDQWKASLPGEIVDSLGNLPIFEMFSLRVKGLINLNPVLGLEPTASIGYSPKVMTVVDYSQYDSYLTALDVSAGCNVWARLAPKRRFSFKTGAGVFVNYSHIAVSGYMGDLSVTGFGFGANLLAGLDITLRRVVITIDGVVPFEYAAYGAPQGTLRYVSADSGTYRYPKSVTSVGFEIRPGITLLF